MTKKCQKGAEKSFTFLVAQSCTKQMQQIAKRNENWKRIAQTFAKPTQICAETTSEKTFVLK